MISFLHIVAAIGSPLIGPAPLYAQAAQATGIGDANRTAAAPALNCTSAQGHSVVTAFGDSLSLFAQPATAGYVGDVTASGNAAQLVCTGATGNGNVTAFGIAGVVTLSVATAQGHGNAAPSADAASLICSPAQGIAFAIGIDFRKIIPGNKYVVRSTKRDYRVTSVRREYRIAA